MVKIKKYLFKYKSGRKYSYYTICYNNINIASRSDYDEIMEIYKECEKNKWDEEALAEIKTKAKSKRKHQQHIYQAPNGSYYIQRFNKHWCSSKNLEEIIKYRDELEENGWNEEEFSYQKSKKRNLPKYISKTGDKYSIYYRNEAYGTYKTLMEAVIERNILMEHDWDYNFVDLY